MDDIVKRLRDECPYKIVEKHNVTDWEEVDRQRVEAADEIERLRRIVYFIANDQLELSHDKIKLQRDDWKKRCKEAL